MSRVVVVGGTRFIGPHVVRLLCRAGHDVLLFHRGETEPTALPDDVRHLHGDRNRLPEFAAEFAKFAPDVLLDMIAMTESDARLAVDVFGDIAARAVVLSSGDVYQAYDVLRDESAGQVLEVPLPEDAPLREKLYPYDTDYDKILVERVFAECVELPSAILRLPMVYGPGDYQHRAYPYLRRMDDRRDTIILEERFADWRVTRGYVDDVAAAIALAVGSERSAGGTYNVGERQAHTESSWVSAIGAAAGWSGTISRLPAASLPSRLLPGLNCEQDLVLDTRRFRDELGDPEPTAPSLAMARTVAWERAHQPTDDAEPFDYDIEDRVLSRSRSGRHGSS